MKKKLNFDLKLSNTGNTLPVKYPVVYDYLTEIGNSLSSPLIIDMINSKYHSTTKHVLEDFPKPIMLNNE